METLSDYGGVSRNNIPSKRKNSRQSNSQMAHNVFTSPDQEKAYEELQRHKSSGNVISRFIPSPTTKQFSTILVKEQSLPKKKPPMTHLKPGEESLHSSSFKAQNFP